LSELLIDPAKHDCARLNAADTVRISNGYPLCQFLGRRKDGSPLHAESTCATFQSVARNFMVRPVRDVTQRERRRMIRDSERRFRAIFEAAAMGIVQCDLGGKILEANPTLQRMLGYGCQELRGTLLRDLIYPEDCGRYSRAFDELV